MRNNWSRGAIILALAAAALLLFGRHLINRRASNEASAPSNPVAETQKLSTTNLSERPSGKVFRTSRTQLTEVEITALETVFAERLKPAFADWCDAYAGHVPFAPDALTTTNFFEKIGRGNSAMYIFMVNGITFGIADVTGTAHVSYLNAPESKKGTPPTTDIPVTRDQLAKMLKADSGIDFSPTEIRMVPTAFSSAMNGGVNVSVGGDAVNIASWKFTLVFGPEGKLNYYQRGQR